MKTLSEIIDAVKNGEKPAYDDLRFALLAMSHLHTFDSSDMLDVFEATTEWNPILHIRAEEAFNRSKRAMNVSPKEYLGENWNPDNPEYQKRRKLMLNLADEIFKGDAE